MRKRSPVLTLAALEDLDPQARPGAQRRFLCPLAGCSDHTGYNHRSLTVHTATGRWHCHRCGEGGTLKEWWVARPEKAKRMRLTLPAPPTLPDPGFAREEWDRWDRFLDAIRYEDGDKRWYAEMRSAWARAQVDQC